MGHGTKDDIENIDEDDPRNQWPKTSKAASMGGMTKRTLENMVRNGEARYVYDTSGERHFDPEWLTEQSGTVSDKEVEADLTKATYDILFRANKTLASQNVELLKLATIPAFKANRILRIENRNLRTRYDALHERFLKSLDAFEAALTTSHERELSRLQAQANEDRKSKGFDTLLAQVPTLVAQLSFKQAIDKFMGSFSSEQYAVLFELMTDEQKAQFNTIMGQKVAAEKAAKAPSSNGVGHSSPDEWNDDNPS